MRTLGLLALMLLAALAANLATAGSQARQSAPSAQAASAQRGPDLLGIYPGMPAAEARRRLQARSDAVRVQDIPVEFAFSLDIGDSKMSETIKVHLTAPPNPPVVWAITRTVTYLPDNYVATSTLLATLREKYGKETASRAYGPTATAIWWVFDQNGQQVASADTRTLETCQAAFQNNMNMSKIGLPRAPYAPWQPCFSSYYALHINVGQSYGPELVNSFTAALVNLPLGYRAATATMNAQNAAAEAARKQELEKARKKKPVF